MKISRPAYFDSFSCIASHCPDSCCQEWDVQVDADSAAKGAETLINIAQAVQARKESSPAFPNGLKVLLVSPILLDPCVANDPFGTLRNGAEESKKFAYYYRHVAESKGVYFLDAAEVAQPSKIDGVHMEPESHLALGKAIAAKVREILE